VIPDYDRLLIVVRANFKWNKSLRCYTECWLEPISPYLVPPLQTTMNAAAVNLDVHPWGRCTGSRHLFSFPLLLLTCGCYDDCDWPMACLLRDNDHPWQSDFVVQIFHGMIVCWLCWLVNTGALMYRLFNYIQPASRLSPGCDYSLFKVCLTHSQCSKILVAAETGLGPNLQKKS